MKINLLKQYTVALFLCSNFVMLAQGVPGNNDDNGALEGTDTPAPIGDYVWVLALIGLLFVFLKFRAIRKQRAHSQA